MRKIIFLPFAEKKYFEYLESKEYELINTISQLLREIDETNDQTDMCGPQEVLYKDLAGWLSRRITWKHRLVYKMDNKAIYVAACREHYPKSNNEE